MDTRQEAAIEFTDNRKVDESTVTSKESDNLAKHATSSEPKKQKVAKRPKRATGKDLRSRKTRLPILCSDDLSSSFKKRRGARCRACFAKRYSSKSTGKKTKRAKKA
jgi:hypothetical protein